MPAHAPRPVLRVRIPSSERADYPVYVGAGILRRLPGALRRFAPAHRYILITDRRVGSLHGRSLVRALRGAGLRTDLLEVPARESSKSRQMKSRLEDRMLELGAGRDSVVIAIGGGMIGDLAGFTASTFLRGIPHVILPTTLLAMVDAAIGGKTGVDHPLGKNLIGTFQQPRLVFADLVFLESLPEREYRCGLAEAVKTAVVGDAALFRRMERTAQEIALRRPRAMKRLVVSCARVKARIVELDERESSLRAVLNFGHTLGHALELLSGYRLPHGEAVAVGMALEASAAERAGVMKKGEAARIVSLLRRFGLPTAPPRPPSATRLLSAARADKKSRGGEIRYSLPRRIGAMATRGGPRVLGVRHVRWALRGSRSS